MPLSAPSSPYSTLFQTYFFQKSHSDEAREKSPELLFALRMNPIHIVQLGTVLNLGQMLSNNIKFHLSMNVPGLLNYETVPSNLPQMQKLCERWIS